MTQEEKLTKILYTNSHDDFEYLRIKFNNIDNVINLQKEVAEDFVIQFTEWKDNNFSMYKDKTYYANTSSQYFDITKYVGKEKPTKYYTAKELLEIFKQTL
jgi:hypothetical protein